MNVVAFMWAHNEADVIGHVIEHLRKQDVATHVFDHWSTDATPRIARAMAWRVERWPDEEPATASWRSMLEHTANRAHEYALAHGPFWALHHDADEIRETPDGIETLHDFFYRVRLVGWNAVDHRLITYAPRDGYDPALHDPRSYFKETLADHMDNRNGQIKAWWQTPDRVVDLAGTGGHRVSFPGRRVCPEKLILRHYPMRGEKQRAAKERSRRERWDKAERAMGWHAQYGQ